METSFAFGVLINGNQVGTLNLPFTVNLGVQGDTGVIGANIEGQNRARFDSVETVLYSITLTTLEVEGLIKYFSSQPRTKYIQFSGTQWMRLKGDKGFYQDLPEAKPIFRNLEEAKPDQGPTRQK